MIAIIDYGMGNLGSVKKALDFIGYENCITDDPIEAGKADAMVLPGVGAISHAMRQLSAKKLDRAVRDFIDSDRPFLGICLGMQMLFETSDEYSESGLAVTGLGILPGTVRRFTSAPGFKVPQIGWNRLEKVSNSTLREGDYVYFVHSYYCDPTREDDAVAFTDYGIRYAVAVERDNVLGMQFHPEKSGETGLAILDRWARRIG